VPGEGGASTELHATGESPVRQARLISGSFNRDFRQIHIELAGDIRDRLFILREEGTCCTERTLFYD